MLPGVARPERLRPASSAEQRELSRASGGSERASEPVSQRCAKRATERSEGVRRASSRANQCHSACAKRATERSEGVR